jgi:hypothetical protein
LLCRDTKVFYLVHWLPVSGTEGVA